MGSHQCCAQHESFFSLCVSENKKQPSVLSRELMEQNKTDADSPRLYLSGELSL